MSSETLQENSRGRRIAWMVLGLPLVIYVVFWPVRARLDRGVIERHLAGSIWHTMSKSLPEIGPQILLEVLFWVGTIGFMAGALVLVWLSLDGAGEPDEPPLDVAQWIAPVETDPLT